MKIIYIYIIYIYSYLNLYFILNSNLQDYEGKIDIKWIELFKNIVIFLLKLNLFISFNIYKLIKEKFFIIINTGI